MEIKNIIAGLPGAGANEIINNAEVKRAQEYKKQFKEREYKQNIYNLTMPFDEYIEPEMLEDMEEYQNIFSEEMEELKINNAAAFTNNNNAYDLPGIENQITYNKYYGIDKEALKNEVLNILNTKGIELAPGEI